MSVLHEVLVPPHLRVAWSDRLATASRRLLEIFFKSLQPPRATLVSADSRCQVLVREGARRKRPEALDQGISDIAPLTPSHHRPFVVSAGKRSIIIILSSRGQLRRLKVHGMHAILGKRSSLAVRKGSTRGDLASTVLGNRSNGMHRLYSLSADFTLSLYDSVSRIGIS